jgi:hypothetical protein
MENTHSGSQNRQSSSGERHLYSHAEAEQIWRRAGYSQQQIDDVLRQLPDPIDSERDGDILFKHGMAASGLMERMGASP